MQIMLTDIAQTYAKAISNHQDAFIIGFVDAWHGQDRSPLRNDDILHAMNMAYDIGYQVGANHRAVWVEEPEGEE